MTSLNSSRFEGDALLDADDALLEAPVRPRKRFRGAVNTVTTSVIQALALIGVEVVMLLPEACPRIFTRAERPCYRSLVVVHAALWALVVLVASQQAVSHSLSKLNGYLNFHRATRVWRKMPAYTLTVGNTALLVFTVVWEAGASRRLLLAVQVLYSVELAICLLATLAYVDVFLEVEARASANDGANHVPRGLSQIDSVLEKQADVIRFMRRHNAKLSARIRTLTEQLDNIQRGSMNPPSSIRQRSD